MNNCSYWMTDEDDSRKSVNHLPEPTRIIECREGDHGWDLKQTDLESVCGTDLHTARHSQ
jgi:hypothetical protein